MSDDPTILPASPGIQCVIWWRGDKAGPGFHEIKPVIGWLVHASDHESVPLTPGNMDHLGDHDPPTYGIILPDGSVDVPHDQTHANLDAFLAYQRERENRASK